MEPLLSKCWPVHLITYYSDQAYRDDDVNDDDANGDDVKKKSWQLKK